MNNPFEVRPMGGYGPMLGQRGREIGMGFDAERQKAAAEQKKTQMEQAFMQAYQSRDPAQVAQFMAQNPEMGARLNQGIKYRNDLTQKNLKNTMKRVLTDRKNAVPALEAHIALVKSQGGNPAESEAVLKRVVDKDPGVFDDIEMEYIVLGDPAEAKNYLAAKEQSAGGAPGYSDVKIAVDGTPWGQNKATGAFEPLPSSGGFKQTPKGALVNVTNQAAPGQKEQDIGYAKIQNQRLGDYVTAASKARATQARLNVLERLSPEAFAGGDANIAMNMAKLGEMIGIETKGLPESEVFTAVSNMLTLGKAEQMSGALSENDMKFLQAAVPGLTQTKAGRKKLIGIMKTLAGLDIELGKEAQIFRKENQGNFEDYKFQEHVKNKYGNEDRLTKYYEGELNPMDQQQDRPMTDEEIKAILDS